MQAKDVKAGDILEWALENVVVVDVQSAEDEILLTVESGSDQCTFPYLPQEECSPGPRQEEAKSC